MKKQLLDNRMYPITKSIGFISYDIEPFVEALLAWERGLEYEKGTIFESKLVVGNLMTVLSYLLPLTTVERLRYLFVPTQSKWTAFFDNFADGGDPFGVISYLCEVLKCHGTIFTSVDDTIDKYGGVSWEVYGPEERSFLNYERSIAAFNDCGRWVFHQSETPYSFEKVERYQARRIRDRFDQELLEEYLLNFGIRAFDEDFYTATEQKPAILVSRRGPTHPSLQQFTLEEARSRLQIIQDVIRHIH